MPFSQRTGYKCLVFLLVVFLLSVQAFSDDLKNKAEENPLNCARYLIAKVYAENDSLSPEPGFLSLAYWKLGRRTEALQMLEFVDNSGEKTYLLMLFAEALAKENHRDEAATLINKAFEITKGSFAWEEMNTFAKMATQLVLLSKDLDALGIAYVLDEAEEQANILTEIAYEYLRQGKNDKALELLAEALPLIKESQYQDRKAFVMAKIGDAYALAGKRVEAGELLSQAAGLNKENAKSNNFSTEKVSCVIANGYLTLGKEEHIPNLFEEPEEAQRILAVHHLKQGEKEKARIILSAIKESYKRDCKNLQIVDWYLMFEDYEAAMEAIKVNPCNYRGGKIDDVLKIARASIGKTPRQEIAEILTYALQEALALSNYEPDDKSHLSVSDAMSKAYELAQISDVMMDANCFDLAFIAVNAIEKPYYKAQKLSDLAGRQIKSLPRQKVLELLSQAWQIANKPTDNPLDLQRHQVQISIASRYAEAGDKAKAAERFAQILESERVRAGEGRDTYLLAIMIPLGEQLARHKVSVNASLKKTLRKILKVWQDD